MFFVFFKFTFVEIFAIKSEEFRKCIIYKRCPIAIITSPNDLEDEFWEETGVRTRNPQNVYISLLPIDASLMTSYTIHVGI